MVGVGNIVSVGGSSGGGSGSTSGITSINGATGPAITLAGVSGVSVVASGNIILIGGEGVTGTGGGGGSTTSADVVVSKTFVFNGISSGLFNHGLGTRNVQVQVIDNSLPPQQIIPDKIIRETLDSVGIVFNIPQTGVAIIHGPSGITFGSGGSSDGSGINAINGDLGPNVDLKGVNGVQITNPAPGCILIDGAGASGIGTINQFSASFNSITSGIFNHNLNTRDVIVQVRDISAPPRVIIPDAIIYDDLDHVSLLFNIPQTGRVTIIGSGISCTLSQDQIVDSRRYALLVS